MKKRKRTQEDSEYALVYSTDPAPVVRCKNCLRPIADCGCVKKAVKAQGKPSARIEKKGRNGKSVTLLAKLPNNEQYLRELLSKLKKSLGCGGTFYIENNQGVLELQGERISEALRFFESLVDSDQA